jgi:predicted AAA+ superfamily ATPase
MAYGRWLAARFSAALRQPYVHVLFGARQTGKSTLLRTLLGDAALWLDLSDPAQRSAYLARPERFVEECRALPRGRGRGKLVVVDEVQAVPSLFDAVQHLYDLDKRRFRFVLSGSSVRKLRVTGTNLLPGRAMFHRLHPLVLAERPATDREAPQQAQGIVPLPAAIEGGPSFPTAGLIDRMAHGELPGIALAQQRARGPLLRAYANVYLEEELRREALVKDWAAFSRFLRLAALESGLIVNYAKIAKDAAVSAPTVKSHYSLLEDMFVGFHVPAFSRSPRKHVLSTPRFQFFDLGVRHAAAGLENNGDTVLANPGPLFEQWVGIELHKRIAYLGRGKLSYFRTKAGAEIDYIVEQGKRIVPVEAKWTDNPTRDDARHLLTFLAEQPNAPRGYVVCRCERPREIAENVTALPWWMM